MMFSNVGHRPRTEQHIRLGATQDGKLTAIRHDFLSQTSQLDEFMERCGEQTPFLYSCPNLVVTAAMVRRNVGAPAPMRGPGAVPGLFGFESAMDELAIKLNMDPLELRLKNDAERDEGKKFALLLATPEGVLHHRRRKDRLEAAHPPSRLDAPQRQDHRDGDLRALRGLQRAFLAVPAWNCAPMAAYAFAAPRRISAPGHTPSSPR